MAWLNYFRSSTYPCRSGAVICRDIESAVHRAKRLMLAGAYMANVWHEGSLIYSDVRPQDAVVLDAEMRLAAAQSDLDIARKIAVHAGAAAVFSQE